MKRKFVKFMKTLNITLKDLDPLPYGKKNEG